MTLRMTIAVAVVATLLACSLWLMTGAHYYTKFQVVERVETPIPEDDPLLDAGFYDDDTIVETVTRDSFHFGLLPTPQGLLDRHVFAVASVVAPIWILVGFTAAIHRLRHRGPRASRAVSN